MQIGAGSCVTIHDRAAILTAKHNLSLREVDFYVVRGSSALKIDTSKVVDFGADGAYFHITESEKAQMTCRASKIGFVNKKKCVSIEKYVTVNTAMRSTGDVCQPSDRRLEFLCNYSSEEGWSGSPIMQDERVVGVHVAAHTDVKLNGYISLRTLNDDFKYSNKLKTCLEESSSSEETDYENDDDEWAYDMLDILDHGRAGNQKLYDSLNVDGAMDDFMLDLKNQQWDQRDYEDFRQGVADIEDQGLRGGRAQVKRAMAKLQSKKRFNESSKPMEMAEEIKLIVSSDLKVNELDLSSLKRQQSLISLEEDVCLTEVQLPAKLTLNPVAVPLTSLEINRGPPLMTSVNQRPLLNSRRSASLESKVSWDLNQASLPATPVIPSRRVKTSAPAPVLTNSSTNVNTGLTTPVVALRVEQRPVGYVQKTKPSPVQESSANGTVSIETMLKNTVSESARLSSALRLGNVLRASEVSRLETRLSCSLATENLLKSLLKSEAVGVESSQKQDSSPAPTLQQENSLKDTTMPQLPQNQTKKRSRRKSRASTTQMQATVASPLES
jgi:hypothetical protein